MTLNISEACVQGSDVESRKRPLSGFVDNEDSRNMHLTFPSVVIVLRRLLSPIIWEAGIA